MRCTPADEIKKVIRFLVKESAPPEKILATHNMRCVVVNVRNNAVYVKIYNWKRSMWTINTGLSNHSKYCFPFK